MSDGRRVGVRGLFGGVTGGVRLRRGRRDPRHLLAGDTLDFWRVEAITPGSLLRLRAQLAGYAYWRPMSPFHDVVFGGILRSITARRADRAGIETPSDGYRAARKAMVWLAARAPGQGPGPGSDGT